MTTKNILMIARHRKVEGLRMATGLTLLDDRVEVLLCGEPEDEQQAEEQLEALEFSDVPVIRIDGSDIMSPVMAEAISKADVVYIL